MFKSIIFNVSKELKLKDVDQKIICKRIKEENIEIVSTSSVLSRETVVTILRSFKKEIEKIIDDRLVRSFEKLKLYLTIIEFLYKIEISSLCFGLSL